MCLCVKGQQGAITEPALGTLLRGAGFILYVKLHCHYCSQNTLLDTVSYGELSNSPFDIDMFLYRQQSKTVLTFGFVKFKLRAG